ncbi:hypothetical protein [Rhodopseudomonas pseudopalustris]|uniref:hypothetical protein n=1 Tax=Rhodopseudomonas pseudopalustris TaxID=1513892 RepID=UPI003F9DFBB8
MGLIRTYRRSGSWLALVALLLQIVLSFGHVHGLAEFADAPSHAALAAAAPTSPAEPPGSHPDGDHHGAPDLCAICATLALVHAGVAATPPALPLPALAGSADSCALPVPAHAALKTAAFQPRAPPTA